MMLQTIEEYKAQGVENIVVYPIGRKVSEKVSKLGFTSGGDFSELAEKPDAEKCRDIADELTSKYEKHEFDKVELIYHHFKSAGSQVLTRRTFLPIDLSTENIGMYNDRDLSSNEATAKAQEYLREKGRVKRRETTENVPLNDDFIVEPDMASVLSTLIPQLLNLMIYTALLDSNASEHAARMVSMQTATDNAN